MAERDPHQEPKNSTVDDWHGQKVDRMFEQVEEMEQAPDDDVTNAEELFLEETDK
jgi:hypothetical protein